MPGKGVVHNSDDEHERLVLSFKAMGGGLWDYDIASDTLFCNSRWYEILGIDQNEHPISSIEDFKPYIHPDDVEIATETDAAQLSDLMARDGRYCVEFRIIRPTGEVRWLRSVACIVAEGEANHLRAVGCITDITEFRGDPRDPSVTSYSPPSGGRVLAAVDGEQVGYGAGESGKSLCQLSEKERECLMWVSMGKTAWETAAILGRSRRTVEFHICNAIGKLGASNNVHAAAIAIRNGFL